VSQRPFIDHYENLQLSPNATPETIERVYRLLAKRYHPDNQSTGDADQFAKVLEAYQTLTDPTARAAYDVKYDEQRGVQWKIFDQSSANNEREQDRRIFHGILSLLYVARRRDPRNPGLGQVYLEKLLGCPQQHLEFPLWYLKQHGWIELTENGQLAITVEGVDKLADQDLALPKDRLLAESSEVENAPARYAVVRR
jgi:curved DNA-binding protein CbpA